MLKNYDNFFLPADDLEQGKAFYQGILGLDIKFDFAARGMVAFRVGDEEPAIILRNTPATKPAIVFEVEDVRHTYEQLKAVGVTFLSEPYEIMTGWAVEFEDPFGNRLGMTDYSKRPDMAKQTKPVDK